MYMYCESCGESVIDDFFGNMVHEYRIKDSHPVLVEECDEGS